MFKLINYILEHRYWTAIGVIVATTFTIYSLTHTIQQPRHERKVIIVEPESPKYDYKNLPHEQEVNDKNTRQPNKSVSQEFIPVVNSVGNLCGDFFDFIYRGEHVKENDAIIFYVNGSPTGWVSLGQSFNFDNNLKNLSITYRSYNDDKRSPVFKYQCSLL